MRRTTTNPVKEARIRALLSMRALAAKAGVSYDIVRAAERDERIGDLSKERIARALGYDERRDLFPENEEATA